MHGNYMCACLWACWKAHFWTAASSILFWCVPYKWLYALLTGTFFLAFASHRLKLVHLCSSVYSIFHNKGSLISYMWLKQRIKPPYSCKFLVNTDLSLRFPLAQAFMSSLCNFQCAVSKDDLLASCFGGMHMQQPECCTSFASNWHTKTGLPQLFQSKGHLFSAATMMCICEQKKKRAQILVWFVSSDLLSHLFCPLYAHVGTVRVFVSVCGLKVIYQLVTLQSLPHHLGLQEHGTAMGWSSQD